MKEEKIKRWEEKWWTRGKRKDEEEKKDKLA
jgi:hypothetical protein